MAPNLLTTLASLKNDALAIADSTSGAAAKMSLNFAIEIGQKIDIAVRISRIDEVYSDQNEREFARDAFEAEFAQPIDLLYGFSAGVADEDLVAVVGLLYRARNLGLVSISITLERGPLN